MAMFSKGRGLFGAPLSADRGASPDAGFVQQAATIPTYKKPSTSNLIIGTIGDTLSQIGGGQGHYLAGLQQQRQAAVAAAQYQQQRADEYSDWQRRQEYEAAHPKPQADDAFARAAKEGGYVPGTPEWTALSRQRAEALANPAQFISNGPGLGGNFVRPNAPAVAPTAPVGRLTPLGVGGATPQGARTFPIR